VEKELFLFIADISGYTAYMVRNQTEAAHGALAINDLMKALVREVSLPIEISKLEGDALFLYLVKEEIPEGIDLAQTLLHFFAVFSKKIRELYHSTVCTCGACSGIEHLKLKIVAHFGKASIEEIGRFTEISGVDVILVHRLLKNAIEGDCYLMVTEVAKAYIDLPDMVESSESDKDLGDIRVATYYPPGEKPLGPKKKLSAFQNVRSHLEIGLGAGLIQLGLVKQRTFHHLPRPPRR